MIVVHQIPASSFPQRFLTTAPVPSRTVQIGRRPKPFTIPARALQEEMEFVGRRICKVVGGVGMSANGRLDRACEGCYCGADVAVLDASYVRTTKGAAPIMTAFVNVAARPALSVAT